MEWPNIFCFPLFVLCENAFTFDGTAYEPKERPTTTSPNSQYRVSPRSELVLGPHPRDVYTARLPPSEWKERESFGYKFSATRRRISLS